MAPEVEQAGAFARDRLVVILERDPGVTLTRHLDPRQNVEPEAIRAASDASVRASVIRRLALYRVLLWDSTGRIPQRAAIIDSD